MDERRGALVEALAAKCAVLLDQQEAAATAGTATPAAAADVATSGGGDAPAAGGADAPAAGPEREAFEAAWRELRKWVDTAAEDKVRWRLVPGRGRGVGEAGGV